MSAILNQYPALANCICRLQATSDFREFVEGMREFSKMADTQAVFGVGELGNTARGVAQAYRKILEMIDGAKPADENNFGSPGDTLDPTSHRYRGQPAPPP